MTEIERQRLRAEIKIAIVAILLDMKKLTRAEFEMICSNLRIKVG